MALLPPPAMPPTERPERPAPGGAAPPAPTWGQRRWANLRRQRQTALNQRKGAKRQRNALSAIPTPGTVPTLQA